MARGSRTGGGRGTNQHQIKGVSVQDLCGTRERTQRDEESAGSVAAAVTVMATPDINDLLDNGDPENDFVGRDLSGLNFDGRNLERYNFSGSNLSGASFVGARLDGAIFDDTDLTNTDFSDAKADRISFNGALWNGTIFDGAVLLGVKAEGLRCEGNPVTLRDTRLAFHSVTRIQGLSSAVFAKTELVAVDWSGEDLSGEKLTGLIELRNSSLVGADMRGAELPVILIEECDMTGVDARGANLSHGFLRSTKGEGANFSGGNLEELSIQFCEIPDANFSDANWFRGDAVESDLSNSNFSDADLSGAWMSNSTFRDCIMVNANLQDTTFGACEDEDWVVNRQSKSEKPIVILKNDITGINWRGAHTEHMNVSEVVDNYEDSTLVCCANFETYTPDEAAEKTGGDTEALQVMIWGGLLEVRDRVTRLPPQGGALDFSRVGIPKWALDNIVVSN